MGKQGSTTHREIDNSCSLFACPKENLVRQVFGIATNTTTAVGVLMKAWSTRKDNGTK